YETYSYKYQIRGTILQAAEDSQAASAVTGQGVQDSTGDEEEETDGTIAGNSEETSGEAEEEQNEEDNDQEENTQGNVITIGDQDVYTAPEAGIVMYSTDGYENKTADSLVEEDFDQMAYKNQNLIVNGEVQPGDSVYKLVTSENWTLMV